MNKQNILIVHNYYQIPGGEDMVVLNEKQMLEEQGHEVTLYSRSNLELKEMSKFQKLVLPFIAIFNIRTYRDIKKIIKEKHIDIVHVHNTLILVSASVYYAAIMCKIPVVQTIHNFRLLCPGATLYRDGHICEDCIKYGLKCAIKHNCYRASKMQTIICVISTRLHRMLGIYRKINYICLTEFNKEKLMNFEGINKERVSVKPNFVINSCEFIPSRERENQFVFAGRLDKIKGIDFLLKSWKQLGADAPKLCICGTGPMEDWCRDYIDKNDINVEMLGFVRNTEVRRLIAKSKALILPTQWYEGFPISIVEAYSVGTPVICTDMGNAGSIVIEGVTGLKFEINSTCSLVKAVQTMVNAQMNELVWDVYKRSYTDTVNYQILNRIYKELKV